MIFFVLCAAFVLFVSFLTGALTKYFFKIDKKYFSFSTPIGFLVFLGILQIGYSIITFKSINPTAFTLYFGCVVGVILLLSIVFYKAIWLAIKNLNPYKIGLALLLTLGFLFVYSYAEINYRFDDLNFYGEFIIGRIYEVGMSDVIYSFQSYFVFLSLIIKNSDILARVGIYTDFFDIAKVIWIPAIATTWLLMFAAVDLIDYVKERSKQKSKMLVLLIWFVACFFFFGEYWNISALHASGILRRLAIPFILILLNNYVVENQKMKMLIPISLIFGGYLAISSSAFFISIFIVYAYFVYCLIKKRVNYLNELAILALFPLSYAYIYDFVYLGSTILRVGVIAFYIVIALLNLFKVNEIVEKLITKCRVVIIVGLPLFMIALSTFVNWSYNISIGDRTFFTPINRFDMVPDLMLMSLQDFAIFFNGLFWIAACIMIYVGFKKKNDDWYTILFGVTVITFFNPFVYDFLVNVVTSVAYFRITDILFNSVILIEMLILLLDYDKYRKFLLGILVVLVIMKCSTFTFDVINTSPEYNTIYHTTQKELDVMDTLSNDYLKFEEKDSFKIASQIYGAQFFTQFEVENVLEDRFSYIVMEESEFERVFYRRVPGFEDVEVNYDHACALAYEKNTDYVILDAQYNWQLQEGLWSCSQLLFEADNYRVLKMNYDYWEWNMLQGNIEKYELQK